MKNMDNNVYGVWAIRSGGSIFGHAEAWCKHYGAPIEFDSKDEAQKYAAELNKDATANCRYSVRKKQHEPGAVKFPLERTPDDKVPAPARRDAPRPAGARHQRRIHRHPHARPPEFAHGVRPRKTAVPDEARHGRHLVGRVPWRMEDLRAFAGRSASARGAVPF